MPERVRYWCLEDDDDAQHPNVFSMPGPAGLDMRLADIKQYFPLPGSFHFRFKRRVGGVPMWVDVGEDEQTVPRWEDGTIFMKVTRLPDDSSFGALKSFLAGMDDEHQPVGRIKSGIMRATGLWKAADEDSPKTRRSLRSSNGTSAPNVAAARPKQPPVAPRFSTSNKSANDLVGGSPEPQRTRSVKSSSPPRDAPPPARPVAPPPPRPVVAPPPRPVVAPRAVPPPPTAPTPPSDLLGLDSPTTHAPASGPNDWNAFVGLDSNPQPPQDPPPMMRNSSSGSHLDIFAQPQQPTKPPQQQAHQFDAFAGFT